MNLEATGAVILAMIQSLNHRVNVAENCARTANGTNRYTHEGEAQECRKQAAALSYALSEARCAAALRKSIEEAKTLAKAEAPTAPLTFHLAHLGECVPVTIGREGMPAGEGWTGEQLTARICALEILKDRLQSDAKGRRESAARWVGRAKETLRTHYAATAEFCDAEAAHLEAVINYLVAVQFMQRTAAAAMPSASDVTHGSEVRTAA